MKSLDPNITKLLSEFKATHLSSDKGDVLLVQTNHTEFNESFRKAIELLAKQVDIPVVVLNETINIELSDIKKVRSMMDTIESEITKLRPSSYVH